MSKTKAQLEAELIAAKSEVIEWVMRHDKLEAALNAAYDELGKANKEIAHLFSEATGWHQQAKRLEDKLAGEMQITLAAANSRIHRMADRKPWKLIAIVAVVSFGLGWLL